MLDIFGKKLENGDRVKIDGTDKTIEIIVKHDKYFLFNMQMTIELTPELVNKINVTKLQLFNIKNNEELFYKIKEISDRLKTLSNLVQNNITVDSIVIQEWDSIYQNNLKDLKEWYQNIKDHIGF